MWPFRRRQLTEATDQQLVATGAVGGSVDEPGWVRVGGGGPREIPAVTLERARAHGVASFRANPLGRAIIDTYVAFCVGDSGVSWQSTDPGVRDVVARFWDDPAVRLGAIQEMLFRDWMLSGEVLWELMVGPTTGVVRISPIDSARIRSVRLRDGNPLWHESVAVAMPGGDDRALSLVMVDDLSGLRVGEALFHPGWRASVHDRRGMPFLSTVIDQLGWFDEVLANLIDRTALARYLVWDVTVNGDEEDVRSFIAERGGLDAPASGTVEVHTPGVKWEPRSVSVGSQEDSTTLASVHTMIAGGTGLAKTWLSDPDGANRATSVSMAEPVRRRIGSVQNEWLGIVKELLAFVVDRAVAAGRIPAMVTVADGAGGTRQVAASTTVKVTGPEIAASDADFSAKVMLNLGTALGQLVEKNILTPEAAKVAAEKAWEQFVGQPFSAELGATPAGGSRQESEADRRRGLRAV